MSWMVLAALIAAFAFAGGGLSAAENRHPEGTRPEQPRVREIFVPFEDLHVLLENQPRRVLLSRAEYEKLLKQAKQTPQTRAPQAAVLVSADYTASIRQERAQLSGRLAIDVLEDGLHAVPLDLGGVGLQAATLDGRGAPIGRADDGRPTLLVEGIGRHELALEMVAPLQTTAARQVLQFRVPRPPAARLRLTVPGDVEVKSGAEVSSRVVDEAGGLTRFELLPQSGDTTLMMTLNSRLQRQSRAVVARSVLVDEVTEAYEKLHATVSLAVLHRAVDRFRFALPDGFEITQVSSPLLARWDVQQESGRRVLAVQLQEQTTETVVLSLSAIKTSAGSQGRATGVTPVPPASATEASPFPRSWRFPRLQPLDVVGQVAVVGLLVEQRLEARSIAANEKELIPIDTAVLSRALPATIFHAEPGTPPLRPVVAYYAPQGDFSLTAEFDKPEAKLAVTTNLLLILADGGQEVRGGFAVLPRQEKRFSLDFSAPADWQVTGVTAADEKPLSFERYGGPGSGTGSGTGGGTGSGTGVSPVAGQPARIHLRLPQAVPTGEEYRVYFHATHTPPGWLGDWEKEEQEVKFPVFAVIGAARDQGAIAVEARDDMTVRPLKVPLRPLDEAEKEKYGLAGVATNLAYRYEQGNPGYEATLAVRRTEPRLTARTFSLLRVQPGALSARYELIYDVQQARTRSLALLLPEKGTPETLSIQGLGDVKLKQYESQLVEVGGRSMRRWNVQLEEARRGAIHLAVVFQQPLPDEQLKDFALPIVAAAGGQSAVGSRQWAGARLAYQSGVVAVEGSAELDVTVKTAARRVDVGELADAEYQPGRRLLGVYGFVGEPAAVSVDASRDPGYGLPEAIVQRAELSTHVSAEGITQTQAQFKLRTKALYLEVRLPPESNLWAASLDGAPLKPQRDQASLLVSLPATPGGHPAGALRDLRIVYETPVAVSPEGKLSVPAPELLLRAGTDVPAVAVPLNDLVWRLHLPNGYEVVRSGGTVVPDQGELPRPLPAAVQVAGVLYWLSGGVNPFWGVQQAAREATWGTMKMKKSDMRTPSEGYFQTLADESRPMPTTEEKPEAKSDVGQPTAEEKAAEPAVMPEGAEAHPPAEHPAVATTVVRPPVPPSAPPEAKPEPQLPPPGRKLEGVRSLQIDLDQAAAEGGQTVTFRSLGVEPQLEVTLARRLQGCMLGWGLALAVGLVGLAITNRRAAGKTRFVLLVALLATLVPLVYDSIAAARVCNMVFYTASLLVPYYLLARSAKWLVGLLRRRLGGWHGHLARGAVAPVATTAAILLLAATVATSDAADPQAGAPPGKDGPYVIQVVEPSPPVDVPEDAVILPYDPASNTGIQGADKLLVPYAKYVELWNRAHPDKKIEASPPPAPYALAGGAYAATLEGDEYLLVSGQLELEVYADGYVTIPLGLAGGVLARAELDGKPARLAGGLSQFSRSENGTVPLPSRALSPLSRSENGTVPLPMQQAQTAPAANPLDARPGTLGVPASDLLVVLYASGKGRHRLELSVRLRLSRQGGWRVAEGVLPAAPATALSLKVPKPQTELRLGRLSDRRSYETGQADEKIETALGTDGAVSIQWRPKVAEALLDRSLTARSTAVLDVQEDGLRMVWRLQLEFGGSQREEFRVGVPADYLLEKVEGSNVRGWQRDQQQPQTVDIMLLRPAKDREDFTFHLWRKGPVGQGGLAEFEVPVVSVGDAALHEGQLTIRRSPLLDLRTLKDSGLRRIDLGPGAVAGVTRSEPPGESRAVGSLRSTTATPPLRSTTATPANAPRGQSDGEADNQQSPLGIRPYQAYHFVTSPFSMRLAATPLEPNLSAVVQTVCKIAEYERSLESRVAVQAVDRPIYGVELLVPEDLEVTQVSTPGGCEWAVESGQSAVGSGRKKLSVYLAAGRQGEVPILLGGTLGERGPVDQLPLPGIEVLHVQRQQGQIAVQLDPAFDVRTENLRNCKSVLLKQLYGWLNPGQQRAVRLALDYDRPDYSGTLRLVARLPEVTCETITNVRVTDRAVEETILLDFTIRNAGIRQLSFRLPAEMKDCRIQVPMLRQQSIEPTGEGDLRVSLELQDEVMDQLRVLVENDRPLGSQTYTAPIPTVVAPASGQWHMGRQYVALEGASRDEVVVDEGKLSGLEVVSRQQKEWDRLKGILGDQITQAYLVAAGAQRAQLVFETKTAKAVETAGARIGLAETVLIVDSHGAYRAAVTYRLDNTTEQFLQIELPPDATLWTAQVAGQPVKPATVPAATGVTPVPPVDPRQVRIPLVKTAPGDLDYAVVLIYGGQMPAPGSLGTANFPLVHTKNVNVELSQVRLFVPKTHRWFAFGGTMGLATLGEEDDLAAGFVSYTTKQVERLRETMRGSGKFAKVRAAYNLKQLDTAMSQLQSARSYDANPNLKAQLKASEDALRRGKAELRDFEAAPQQAEVDNRLRLNTRYEGQKSSRARNVVQDLGGNWFGQPGQAPAPEAPEVTLFNGQWLYKNQLSNEATVVVTTDGQPRPQEAGKPGGAKPGQPVILFGGIKLAGEVQSQPKAPEVAQGAVKAGLVEAGQATVTADEETAQSGHRADDTVVRYQNRLEQQVARPPAVAKKGSAAGLTTGDVFSVDRGIVPFAPDSQGQAATRAESGVDMDALVAAVSQRVQPGGQRQMTVRGAAGLPTAVAPPTGLASLQLELPEHEEDFYQVYRFSTPRGEVEITAWAVSENLLTRLLEVAAVLIAVGVLGYCVRLARARRFARLWGATGSTLMICVGLLALLFGILPVVGLVALVGGVVIKVRRAAARSVTASRPITAEVVQR